MATRVAVEEPKITTPVLCVPHRRCIEADTSSTANSDLPHPPQTNAPTEILDEDRETPDAHVARDYRLIRLTGVHPFNVEAPLTALFDEGFVTSQELFYVRNHGAVPRVLDEDMPRWEISIEGLVDRPMVLSLQQIIANFEQITAPVTLVCAGNRRKEQNQVQKTNGFSWGAAGVSTSLFTGPLLAEVLKKAGPLRTAKYVCMEGADDLPNGKYGTSLKLSWVLDPDRLIMLAHTMNGEPLRPDHGRPLRVVVPGQIGGRSVKWLKRLILTKGPSENWYHVYDNRVLPTMVTPEMASKDPSWWRDERYAIYDLSVNSAIVYPAHGERLSIAAMKSYRARGYAYSGGGRRVTRVEISLDRGASWRLADIEYPEDKYRDTDETMYGGRIDMSQRETCFCWCLWSLDVPVSDIDRSNDILLRAMDESMNLQPRDMYWSVLGMMNNPWYRVAIARENGTLRFEHPTQPATQPGGWMERVKKAGGNLLNGHWGEQVAGEAPRAVTEAVEVEMKKDGLVRTIELEELKRHASGDQPWFVVRGEVYDGTSFLQAHPGGAQSIVSAAGTDVADEFLAIHSDTAKGMMTEYHIGTLDPASRDALGSVVIEELPPSREVFLHPRVWTKAVLLRKEIISWDTRKFTFKLDHGQQALGVPAGQHLMIRMVHPSSKELLLRAYTPLSETNARGEVALLVKIYFSTETFLGGAMTTALEDLPMGSVIDFKGPIGNFEYLGRGQVSIGGIGRQVRSFCMICGGSGITPIFQVYRAVMQDPEDRTVCVVLDGNRWLEDILCKDELDQLTSGHSSSRGKVVHTLTKPPEDWTGCKGRISEELVREHAVPDDDTLVLICGPPAMEESLHQILLKYGWKDPSLVFF
ncbi:MAG: hypothetical protein M1838_001250 [Thelocarpon superellum]|nr:MAG: hypothetical protein M1838_001250 [Thelocarpon superellum]